MTAVSPLLSEMLDDPVLQVRLSEAVDEFFVQPADGDYKALRKAVFTCARRLRPGYDNTCAVETSGLVVGVVKYFRHKSLPTSLHKLKEGMPPWALSHYNRATGTSGFAEALELTKPVATHATSNELTGEITMAAIETKTFIFGVDAANVSDAKIFEHIVRIEGEINHLKSIEHKPAALTRRIDELTTDIMALVDFSNNRGAEEAK